MEHPEFAVRPRWYRTGDPYFTSVARVDDRWWVLRINSFPDHPLFTLFVDGDQRLDLDDLPAHWGRPLNDLAPVLDAELADEALAPIRDFIAYGSELGRPCDNVYCCG